MERTVALRKMEMQTHSGAIFYMPCLTFFSQFTAPPPPQHTHTSGSERSTKLIKSLKILVPDNNIFLSLTEGLRVMAQTQVTSWGQRTECINTSTGSERAREPHGGQIAGLSQALVLPLDCHLSHQALNFLLSVKQQDRTR